MEYEDIQRVVIVYGTNERIEQFLQVNVQAIEEDREEKIELVEIENSRPMFKDLKYFIWKRD